MAIKKRKKRISLEEKGIYKPAKKGKPLKRMQGPPSPKKKASPASLKRKASVGNLKSKIALALGGASHPVSRAAGRAAKKERRKQKISAAGNLLDTVKELRGKQVDDNGVERGIYTKNEVHGAFIKDFNDKLVPLFVLYTQS